VKRRYEILIYLFIVMMFIVGGLLGVYLIGKEEGVFDLGLAGAVIGGSVGGILISLFVTRWLKKRRGNIPEVDERSLVLMRRYFLVVLYVVLIGSGALLLVLFGMGIQYIETGMLIVYMMILYILIGIGAVVVKRF
jgi:peptidoglycan biosynthesis protein MviN/MurJ (putative lipid II flippase)